MKLTLKEKGVLFGVPVIFCICLMLVVNISDTYIVESKLIISESPIGKIQRGALKGVDRSVRKLIRLSHGSRRASSLQSFQEKIAMVESRQFLEYFIAGKTLKPMLFPKRWNKDTQSWLKKEPGFPRKIFGLFGKNTDKKSPPNLLKSSVSEPSDRRSVKRIKKAFRVIHTQNSGIVTMRLRWKDPEAGAVILNELVDYANVYISMRERNRVERDIEKVKEILAKETMPELKIFLLEHMESMNGGLITQDAKIAPTFKVLDMAYPPHKSEFRIPKVLMLVGLVCGFLCSLIFLLVQRVKHDDTGLNGERASTVS